MSQTLSLYRLQQTDTTIDRTQARLQVIQKILEDNQSLRDAMAQTEIQEKNFKAAEHFLRQAEQIVQDQRIKIEQTESNLYSGTVRDPKELQDLQNDVASLKRHLTALEDRQLETMMALEETESTYKSAQEILSSTQTKWAQQGRDLTQEQAGLLKELERWQTERQAIAGAISPENLELYQTLRKQRRGLAVVIISDNACVACGSTLTPAQQQSARSDNQIVYCPSCGRILFGN